MTSSARSKPRWVVFFQAEVCKVAEVARLLRCTARARHATPRHAVGWGASNVLPVLSSETHAPVPPDPACVDCGQALPRPPTPRPPASTPRGVLPRPCLARRGVLLRPRPPLPALLATVAACVSVSVEGAQVTH